MDTARRPRLRTTRAAAWRWLWLALGLLALLPGLASAAPGLVGRYFNNMSLSGTPALIRVDDTVNYDWSTAAPGTGVNADNFSIRWTGYVRVATTGSYNFQTITDDGVRLYVNGALLINNWGDHSVTTDTSAAVTLTAGVDYPIVLEFYENFVYAVAKLLWKKPGDAAYSVVPASNGSLGLSTGVNALLEYRFEQGTYNSSAGEVLDTSGNGFDGTGNGLSGSVPTVDWATPGRAGNPGTCGYAVFDRSTKDNVTLPSNFPNLPAMGSFTVTAWIRTTDRTQAGQRIFIQDEYGYAGSTNGYIFSLGDRGAGMLNFTTRATNMATDETITPAVIANNTWYFVSFGVDAAAKRKFIVVLDASGNTVSSVSTTYTTTSIGSVTGLASIGGETDGAWYEATSSFGFAGNIDEVRVYPGALTTSELAGVFALNNTCPGLTAAYRFEESTTYNGTAGELKDSAGHPSGPFNGRAQGAALPSTATASPARTGTTGTCGYASLPGPNGAGGYFTVTGLPTNTATGGQNTVSFWVYWNGTDDTTPISWDIYNLWFRSGVFGFNTGGNDIYATSSTGLANGWHHVVAVFTNGSVSGNKLYIDGVAKTLAQYVAFPTNGNANASTTLRVGTWSYSAGTSALIGRVDELKVYNRAVTTTEVAALYAETHACSVLHHLELRHGSGTGLTCTPSTVTVAACQDSACSTPYTGGVSGTVTASGTGMTVNWPTGAAFSIAAGSSSTTKDFQLTTAGSVLLALSGLSSTPTSASTCNFGSPSCTFTAADAGLYFDVPNHVSEVAQTVSVSAVKKSDNSLACVPAFASVSKNINFSCSHLNPASGSRAVRVGGSALNAANNASAACDATGRAVSLAFNASGVASTTVQYADVGRLQLNASYTGSGSDAGLSMTGSDTFIAAPASFAISGVTAAPIKAGSAFSATITARNSAGATAPSFGLESSPEGVGISFTRAQPTGTGAVTGTFTGSAGAFSAGVATASNLVYSEVGKGDLNVALASGSYLGSGLTASGSTGTAGAVGKFIPHHFDVAVTPGCGSFSYAGQPFTVSLTARNGLSPAGITRNYDGTSATSPNFAQAVTLSDAVTLGVGSWSNNAVAASAFSAGVASSALPSYAFTDKLTSARTLTVRAVDADGASSSGYTEGSTGLRSGRLRVANAVGSNLAALQLQVLAEYWGGSAWVINSADSCTSVPAAAVARSNVRDGKGNAASWTSTASAISLSSGSGLLTLGVPSPAGSSGTLDLALNLGSSSPDQSCNANHPASTGAGLAWLRSRNGSCAATWDRDPAARASFGVYAPETRKTVHVREIF